MNEHDQLAGGARRRARHRHLVMGGEAILVVVALLLTLGLFDLGPEPTRADIPLGAPLALGVRAADRRLKVMVIGDSLIVQSTLEQREALAARGYDVVVAGQSGRALDTPWIQAQVARAAADPTIDIVVLATAANDNFANSARASQEGDEVALRAYRKVLDDTFARLGKRCIVAVDARDRVDGYFAPHYAPKTNAVLASVVAGRPHSELVAWSDQSRPHGADWFAHDQVHFHRDTHGTRPIGAVAYAAAIADGVDRCADDR